MINLKKISIITILIILITCLAFIIEEKSNVKTVETSAQSLSTKKIGWGIKRNDNHKQPDLGKINKEIIETLDAAAFNPDGLRGNILEQCSAGICIYGR